MIGDNLEWPLVEIHLNSSPFSYQPHELEQGLILDIDGRSVNWCPPLSDSIL